MISADSSISSVGRAEHSIVSSCVAQKSAFPKVLLFFFLSTKQRSQQPNNIVKCGVDGSFAISFAVPVWLMVSGFILREAGLFMKRRNCSFLLMPIHSGSINLPICMQ